MIDPTLPGENLRCIIFMVIAMAGFAIEDSVIKQLSYSMPISQVLMLIGLGGLLMFSGAALTRRTQLFTSDIGKPWFLIRTLAELFSAIFFVVAIVYASLSTSSAILQATPLVVSLVGVLFLRQVVFVQQWFLILVGFIGVIFVIQPGMDDFNPAALFAVVGVLFLAVRDAITRFISVSIPAIVVSFWAFFAVFMAGVVTIPFFASFRFLTPGDLLLLLVSALAGSGAYFCIVLATRGGDIAVVSPFRYSRLLFALMLAVIFFDEEINSMMLVGSGLITISGVLMIRWGGARKVVRR